MDEISTLSTWRWNEKKVKKKEKKDVKGRRIALLSGNKAWLNLGKARVEKGGRVTGRDSIKADAPTLNDNPSAALHATRPQSHETTRFPMDYLRSWNDQLPRLLLRARNLRFRTFESGRRDGNMTGIISMISGKSTWRDYLRYFRFRY